MREFKFKNDRAEKMTITIDGKNYTFNPVSYKVKKASEKFVLINKTLINNSRKENITKEQYDNLIIKSCELVKETITSILGKNAYDRIFNDRAIDFKEHQEVMTFIFEEITDYSKKIVNEHSTN